MAPPMIELDDWLADPVSGERSRPDSMSHDAGTLIGGCYRVVGPLGTGSMGIVLLARDEALDRPVAIKFVHSHLLSAPFRDRFIAEARTMARVNHPNVVQVHAFGEHDGAPYFVMEYVDGFTLERWIARNPDSREVDVLLAILGELCRGVSAIHGSGAVHHDIKPSNVLLDAALRPRVADLGLAVFHRDGSPTQREIVGTPTYMAPEIAFSNDLDPQLRSRADVYSLACVAYELFSGRPPFDGTGNIGMLLQHATKPVLPPSSFRPDLPPELDRALLAALAKDPRHRTPSAEAFRQDLVAACRKEREPVRVLVAEDDDDFRDALRSCFGSRVSERRH
jgi:serine/threonine protein kinase